ncbi:SpoIIE family protein phosphatase [Streptomyces sp. NPDC046831]|uniref:SpoIIE family protein phosphatase n=1 Tax=Streptomyces sp. NPDC046831 TaxID=3154805 RepID=UPI0033F355F9
MPFPLPADRPAAEPPGPGPVDALITQARRLKGEVDAVRRVAGGDEGDDLDPRGRWERALYDLALHQLDDLDQHLAQLRAGPPTAPDAAPATGTASGSLLGRVGSAEWNLLTDEASWSGELYRILGRDAGAAPLPLDELPSLVLAEDRPALTASVTDCLVDARPLDGEFRIVRPDGTVRTVHMMGEPVLDADGGTASMWAVLRDVSELRSSQRAVRETRDALRRHRHPPRTGQQLTAGPQEAAPPWTGVPRLQEGRRLGVEVAAGRLPGPAGGPGGGAWCDALELPDGDTLLTVGRLTGPGPGPGASRGAAMLLGALRGMAMAGARPGRLMTLLDELLGTTSHPAPDSAVCCRYRPGTRTLLWAGTGGPAPLLFRDGTGRVPGAPDGTPCGAGAHAARGQAEVTLRVGDLLLLHAGGPMPGGGTAAAVNRLLGTAARRGTATTARDCLRAVVEGFGAAGGDQDACLLVARVTR